MEPTVKGKTQVSHYVKEKGGNKCHYYRLSISAPTIIRSWTGRFLQNFRLHFRSEEGKQFPFSVLVEGAEITWEPVSTTNIKYIEKLSGKVGIDDNQRKMTFYIVDSNGNPKIAARDYEGDATLRFEKNARYTSYTWSSKIKKGSNAIVVKAAWDYDNKSYVSPADVSFYTTPWFWQ